MDNHRNAELTNIFTKEIADNIIDVSNITLQAMKLVGSGTAKKTDFPLLLNNDEK